MLNIASLNHILVITMGEPSNVSTAAIHPSVGCRQYLVTYSQADESRKFLENDRRACSREEHQNHGFHYY